MLSKRIILIISAIILCSCGGTQETAQERFNKKIKRYTCLTSASAENFMINYRLEVPNNWCLYKGFHDSFSVSPKSLKGLKENHYKNYICVYSYINDTYISENIEESLSKHVVQGYVGNYSPVYTPDTHKDYGKYYIIKYRSKWNGDDIMNIRFLFNYKGQDHIISYSVLEKDYDTYIDSALQIMSTFKIVE